MYTVCFNTQARALLKPDCAVLSALGKDLSYEVAVGENGAFWVNSAGGVPTTAIIANAILNAEVMDEHRTVAMVDRMLKDLKADRKQKRPTGSSSSNAAAATAAAAAAVVDLNDEAGSDAEDVFVWKPIC
jgi:exosome complex RNA-binding protein Rrp4